MLTKVKIEDYLNCIIIIRRFILGTRLERKILLLLKLGFREVPKRDNTFKSTLFVYNFIKKNKIIKLYLSNNNVGDINKINIAYSNNVKKYDIDSSLDGMMTVFDLIFEDLYGIKDDIKFTNYDSMMESFIKSLTQFSSPQVSIDNVDITKVIKGFYSSEITESEISIGRLKAKILLIQENDFVSENETCLDSNKFYSTIYSHVNKLKTKSIDNELKAIEIRKLFERLLKFILNYDQSNSTVNLFNLIDEYIVKSYKYNIQNECHTLRKKLNSWSHDHSHSLNSKELDNYFLSFENILNEVIGMKKL